MQIRDVDDGRRPERLRDERTRDERTRDERTRDVDRMFDSLPRLKLVQFL